MATLKLFLLVVTTGAQLYAATPPNARPPTEQLREQDGLDRVARPFQVTTCFWAILEASVIIALIATDTGTPHPFARALLQLLPPPTSLTALTTPTPIFLTGTFLTLLGALLRAHCYRTLGHRFTFELAIRPSHTLVMDGLYGIVRHPSYTASFMLAMGSHLCTLDPRGLVAAVVAEALQVRASATDGDGVLIAVLACLLATLLGMSFVALSRRMDMEDAMLEKNFGEAWRAWAKRVPYRLVPGVY